VTAAMEKNISLISLQNTYQGKSSVHSPNCTNAICQEAKICYMRNGSVVQGDFMSRGGFGVSLLVWSFGGSLMCEKQVCVGPGLVPLMSGDNSLSIPIIDQ
jgi:hypothetical protein